MVVMFFFCQDPLEELYLMIDDKDAILLVYDITNRRSWDYLIQKYEEIQEELELVCPEIPIIVLGNKYDAVRVSTTL